MVGKHGLHIKKKMVEHLQYYSYERDYAIFTIRANFISGISETLCIYSFILCVYTDTEILL